MFVRDKNGVGRTAYSVRHNGVRYCSECGHCMDEGEWYTRFTPFHPITGKPGLMGVRCMGCFPCTPAEHHPEDFDTPVRVSTPPPVQNTTGSMRPLPADLGWRREKPNDVSEALTHLLPTPDLNKVDPKFKKMLNKVFSR